MFSESAFRVLRADRRRRPGSLHGSDCGTLPGQGHPFRL